MARREELLISRSRTLRSRRADAARSDWEGRPVPWEESEDLVGLRGRFGEWTPGRGVGSTTRGEGWGEAERAEALRIALVVVEVEDSLGLTFRLGDRDGPEDVDPILPDFEWEGSRLFEPVFTVRGWG
jgi:hypothetical protein